MVGVEAVASAGSGVRQKKGCSFFFFFFFFGGGVWVGGFWVWCVGVFGFCEIIGCFFFFFFFLVGVGGSGCCVLGMLPSVFGALDRW